MNKISVNCNKQVRFSLDLCRQLGAVGLGLDPSVTVARNLMFEHCVCFLSGCKVCRSKIGAYSYCSPRTAVTTATVGRYCSIGHDVELGMPLYQLDRVSASVALQPNQAFSAFTGQIPECYQAPLIQGETTSQVTIGHDVWIGCHCLFPRAVTVGHGAVIAAGSVITKDVPPYAIVAGTDEIKGYRFPDEEIADLLALKWWHYDLPKMMSSGIKVPLKKARDFITFLQNEEREHLLELPARWFYLNLNDANSVQIIRVDPEHSSLGTLTEPAELAVLNEDHSAFQPSSSGLSGAQVAPPDPAEEKARIMEQVQAMMRAKQQH